MLMQQDVRVSTVSTKGAAVVLFFCAAQWQEVYAGSSVEL